MSPFATLSSDILIPSFILSEATTSERMNIGTVTTLAFIYIPPTLDIKLVLLIVILILFRGLEGKTSFFMENAYIGSDGALKFPLLMKTLSDITIVMLSRFKPILNPPQPLNPLEVNFEFLIMILPKANSKYRAHVWEY